MLNNPPAPTTSSPTFRYLVLGIIVIAILIFVNALHRPKRNELANLKEITKGWWTNMDEPKPKPAPRIMPTPAPHPILVLQKPPPPPLKPLPKRPSEYWERWRRAVLTGMGGNSNNVGEIPQLVNGQPVATPAPNIFSTYGAYVQQ